MMLQLQRNVVYLQNGGVNFCRRNDVTAWRSSCIGKHKSSDRCSLNSRINTARIIAYAPETQTCVVAGGRREAGASIV